MYLEFWINIVLGYSRPLFVKLKINRYFDNKNFGNYAKFFLNKIYLSDDF